MTIGHGNFLEHVIVYLLEKGETTNPGSEVVAFSLTN